MTRSLFGILAIAVLSLTLAHAVPPTPDRAAEYAAQLLDEHDPQRHMAAARLKAVNAKARVPAEVEVSLASFLVRPSPQSPERADMINLVASVLATSHGDSPAIDEIITALTTVLDREPVALARRGSVEALFMIARQKPLPPQSVGVVEDRAFNDSDRKVRIGAMRTLIEMGPGEQLKQRLNSVLMERAQLDEAGFAAPGPQDYDSRTDHNAVLRLLWHLHEPMVPDAVMAVWVSKLTGGNLHDTAYRMLENVVNAGALPQPIYDQLLAAAERDARGVDSRRREALYRLLQRSRAAQATKTGAATAVDTVALARTLAFDSDTGRRRTAGHLLREFANDTRPADEALDMLVAVAETEPDLELRQLALRILGYAAPEDYVDVLHGYFDTGRYDNLVLRIFLASYGREAWIRKYASDPQLHPKVRAAAMYDYSHSGFAVPGDVISLLQDIARSDAEYSVRQAAGQSLRHLNAWVPIKTRLEREENQQQALFTVWLAAIGVYPLSGLLGGFFLAARWRRVRERLSGVALFGWFAVAAVLVPVVGIGALSLLRHNGPTPTVEEMLFTFLPTYLLVGYFAYIALQIARAGLNGSQAAVPGEVA